MTTDELKKEIASLDWDAKNFNRLPFFGHKQVVAEAVLVFDALEANDAALARIAPLIGTGKLANVTKEVMDLVATGVTPEALVSLLQTVAGLFKSGVSPDAMLAAIKK